ncbi:hypothetical protein Microterr_29840 [Microbacterium terricola]|uniref:Methyltransferase domain-containing protein n=1 Tax=Microbacterium terricola TaxID=344163 RepID=A0ABM8E2X3_9MICO|nr:hypothetical protein Microterr_29840 [Microbacterium terricola]
MAAWAADCAERVLHLFEAEAPADDRPRNAIARARAFARGELSTAGEIRQRFVAGRAAHSATSPAGVAAARAAAQAAGVAHMGAHALGAAAYAARAAGFAADGAVHELEWQLAHLSPEAAIALRQLPPLGDDTAGPLGPGLLASGDLGEHIRRIQADLLRTRDDPRTLWDAEAETFDDAPDHGLLDPDIRRAWAHLLLPLIGGRGRRIADLGCGTGTLSVLLATEGGHLVTGVDFSPEMVRRAREKASDTAPEPEFIVGDAADPPLPLGGFDVVLSRHVLWAMPDPATALQTWLDLLTPTGILILVEGQWHTGVGLSAEECFALVSASRKNVEIRMFDDPAYWGGPVSDERYLIVSTP